jgi:hypothetical protein
MQRADDRQETSHAKPADRAGSRPAGSGPGFGPAEAADRPHAHRCGWCGRAMVCRCDAMQRAYAREVTEQCHGCYMRILSGGIGT